MQYRVIGHTATRLTEGWSELMQEVKTVPTLVGPNLSHIQLIQPVCIHACQCQSLYAAFSLPSVCHMQMKAVAILKSLTST